MLKCIICYWFSVVFVPNNIENYIANTICNHVYFYSKLIVNKTHTYQHTMIHPHIMHSVLD